MGNGGVLEKVWSSGDCGSRVLGLVSVVSIVFHFRFSEVRRLSLSFPFPVVCPRGTVYITIGRLPSGVDREQSSFVSSLNLVV
jgi:hypothetical protein